MRTPRNEICMIRNDIQHLDIPYGDNKYLSHKIKRKRFPFRWIGEDEETFQIKVNGAWHEAQSIDFDFLTNGTNGNIPYNGHP